MAPLKNFWKILTSFGHSHAPILESTKLGRTNNEVQINDVSQHGEYLLLTKLIDNTYPKYLVDVGAHDGISLSNSWPFVLQGWNAVLIEPLPKVFQRLIQNHKNHSSVICVNKACSDQKGVLPLFIGDDGEEGTMSTLCADQNEWFDAHRTSKSINVEVQTLTQILQASNMPKDFSLLLIDAEGMDYEVIKGLDFDQFRPRIVVTEEYPSNQVKYKQKCNGQGLAEELHFAENEKVSAAMAQNRKILHFY